MIRSTLLLAPLTLAACTAAGGSPATANEAALASSASLKSTEQPAETPLPFNARVVADFTNPWAMAWLPDGRSALVTEQQGALKLWTDGGPIRTVAGVPDVDYGGQGGLGDVVLAPDFATTGDIYLSYVEAGEGDTRGAVVIRATLEDGSSPRLTNIHRIWEQVPKVTGRGHFSHRIAFSPDGKYLWITSGERQKKEPAQELANNLGSTLRLFPDGSVPSGQPLRRSRRTVTAQVWSSGHRNLLGHRLRQRRPAVDQRDGAEGRRRGEPGSARRQLRLAGGVERRGLRRHADPRITPPGRRSSRR